MTGTPATLIGRLNTLGYELFLEGDKVRYRYTLPDDPPADKVTPLLDELREQKADIIIRLRLKSEFDRLAGYLRQRNYTPENMAKLREIYLEMDEAWEAMDYPAFKKVIDEMIGIPGILRPESGHPYAARIFSKILNEYVWIVSSPEAISFVPEGEVYYLSEEIRGLKGASPEDLHAVHRVKKELGGCLVSVKERQGTA